MENLPPIIQESDFQLLEKRDEKKMQTRFAPRIKELQVFLNQLPCLQDVQKIRKKEWMNRTEQEDAFKVGDSIVEPNQWYTYHRGGRSEVQFNVGLLPKHFRIGLGFEFTERGLGDQGSIRKEGVTVLYANFRHVIQEARFGFDELVRSLCLEIEWNAEQDHNVTIVPTNEAIEWLSGDLPRYPAWIFVGRLLRRKADASILENPSELKQVFENVFGGLKPIWKETQIRARRNSRS